MASSTAEWTILFQQTGLRFAETAELPLRRRIKAFLTELATGIRDEENADVAVRFGKRIVRRGKVLGERRGVYVATILWTTDYAYVHEQRRYQEVIHVWAMFTPDDVAEQQHLEELQSLWGSRSLRQEGSLVGHVQCPQVEKLQRGMRVWPRSVKCHADLDMAWLSKFVHFPQQMRDKWEAGKDLLAGRLPIVGTEEQQKFVLEPGPLILVGRAGSGKTLVLRDRLWHHFVEFKGLGLQQRQVFLTLSPALARSAAESFGAAREQYFPDSPDVVFEEDLDLTMGLEALPDAPIFVSLRTFLKLLGTWLNVPLLKRPMLEAEFEDIACAGLPRPGGRALEMTFLGFLEWFWPNFAKHKRQVDVLTAWSEIQSYIKGIPAKDTDVNMLHMSWEDYSNMSKRQTVGLEPFRGEIYCAFQEYLKFCRKYNGFDRMDLAQAVLAALKRHPEQGPWIDWLYVDEVQDLAMVEVELCLRCLRDLKGAAFGGDTTQTISQGISFRFCDVDSAMMAEMHRRQGDAHKPRCWSELTVNHRSHEGLVKFSNVFASLLETLFPWTIDKLAPARSSLKGDCPTFVDASRSLQAFTLGSEQVFLVPSKYVALPPGWSGVKATPAQVKGLEHTDVVLLDWWADSGNAKLWQLLLDSAQDIIRAWDGEPGLKFADKWQVAERVPLSKELKQLFVAVTRAQHSLVVCSTKDCPQSRGIMDFLKQLRVASEDTAASTSLRSRSAQQQDSRSFEQRGDAVFRKRQYDVARQSFTLALNSASLEPSRQPILQEKVKVCTGFLQMRAARQATGQERLQTWRDAAETFHGIQAYRLQRAICLKEYAQLLDPTKARLQLFAQAAGLFEAAGDMAAAAETYELGQCYHDAAQLYKQTQDWKNAARCILQDERLQTQDIRQFWADCVVEVVREGNVVMPYRHGDCKTEPWPWCIVNEKGWWTEGALMARECGETSKWKEAEYHKKAENFELAGAAYEQAGENENAADCYVRVGDDLSLHRAARLFEASHLYKQAAEAVLKFEQDDVPRAAELFSRGGYDRDAAEHYLKCGDLKHAAASWERAGKFEIAVGLFEQAELWEDVVRNCRLRAKQVEKNEAWTEGGSKLPELMQWRRAAGWWCKAKNYDREAIAWTAALKVSSNASADGDRHKAVDAWLRHRGLGEADHRESFLHAVGLLARAHAGCPLPGRFHDALKEELAAAEREQKLSELIPVLQLSLWDDGLEGKVATALTASGRLEDQRLGKDIRAFLAPHHRPCLGSLSTVIHDLVHPEQEGAGSHDGSISTRSLLEVKRALEAFEGWAKEGPEGFFEIILIGLGASVEDMQMMRQIALGQLADSCMPVEGNVAVPVNFASKPEGMKPLQGWGRRFVEVPRDALYLHWIKILAPAILNALPSLPFSEWREEHDQVADLLAWMLERDTCPRQREEPFMHHLKHIVMVLTQNGKTSQDLVEAHGLEHRPGMMRCLQTFVKNSAGYVLPSAELVRCAVLVDVLSHAGTFDAVKSVLEGPNYRALLEHCPEDWTAICSLVLPRSPTEVAAHAGSLSPQIAKDVRCLMDWSPPMCSLSYLRRLCKYNTLKAMLRSCSTEEATGSLGDSEMAKGIASVSLSALGGEGEWTESALRISRYLPPDFYVLPIRAVGTCARDPSLYFQIVKINEFKAFVSRCLDVPRSLGCEDSAAAEAAILMVRQQLELVDKCTRETALLKMYQGFEASGTFGLEFLDKLHLDEDDCVNLFERFRMTDVSMLTSSEKCANLLRDKLLKDIGDRVPALLLTEAQSDLQALVAQVNASRDRQQKAVSDKEMGSTKCRDVQAFADLVEQLACMPRAKLDAIPEVLLGCVRRTVVASCCGPSAKPRKMAMASMLANLYGKLEDAEVFMHLTNVAFKDLGSAKATSHVPPDFCTAISPEALAGLPDDKAPPIFVLMQQLKHPPVAKTAEAEKAKTWAQSIVKLLHACKGDKFYALEVAGVAVAEVAGAIERKKNDMSSEGDDCAKVQFASLQRAAAKDDSIVRQAAVVVARRGTKDAIKKATMLLALLHNGYVEQDYIKQYAAMLLSWPGLRLPLDDGWAANYRSVIVPAGKDIGTGLKGLVHHQISGQVMVYVEKHFSKWKKMLASWLVAKTPNSMEIKELVDNSDNLYITKLLMEKCTKGYVRSVLRGVVTQLLQEIADTYAYALDRSYVSSNWGLAVKLDEFMNPSREAEELKREAAELASECLRRRDRRYIDSAEVMASHAGPSFSPALGRCARRIAPDARPWIEEIVDAVLQEGASPCKAWKSAGEKKLHTKKMWEFVEKINKAAICPLLHLSSRAEAVAVSCFHSGEQRHMDSALWLAKLAGMPALKSALQRTPQCLRNLWIEAELQDCKDQKEQKELKELLDKLQHLEILR